MRHVEELKIELHNLVEIYKDDSRDCADIDQPECIKDAMKAHQDLEGRNTTGSTILVP